MNESPTAASGRRRAWMVAAAAIAAGAGWSWWHQPAPPPNPTNTPGTPGAGAAASGPDRLGADFWALSLPQADEQPLALRTLQGRPLLLNFWATWCPPCVREMPLLDDFYKQMQTFGMNMLGIAVDSPSPVRGFLARSPVSFPVVLAGADGSGLSRTLGNGPGGLPFTVLADAEGNIVERQIGELSREQLQRWAATLRQARPAPT